MTTQAQHRALRAIDDFINIHGYPPSRRELSEALDYACASSAQGIIDRLENQGLVTVAPGRKPRAMRITESGMKALTEEL